MSDKKEKRIRLTTPVPGIWVWPKLNQPETKFKKQGEYGLKVKYTPEEAASLQQLLEPLYQQALEEAKAEWEAQTPPQKKKNPFKENPYYEPEYDKDGNETGYILFKFATDASGTKKDGSTWEFKPKIFNGANPPQLLSNPPKVGNGSFGKVSFEVRPYFIPATGAAGMSMKLSAVQVLRIVSGGSASDYGFGAEEGYEAVSDGQAVTQSDVEEMEPKHGGPDF